MPKHKDHRLHIFEVNSSFTQNNLAWFLQEIKGRNLFKDVSTEGKGYIKIIYKDIEIVVQFPLRRLLSKPVYVQQQTSNGFGETHLPMDVTDYTSRHGDGKEDGVLYSSDTLNTSSTNDTSPAILEVEHIPDVWVGLKNMVNKPPQPGLSIEEFREEEDNVDLLPFTVDVSSSSNSSLWESTDDTHQENEATLAGSTSNQWVIVQSIYAENGLN